MADDLKEQLARRIRERLRLRLGPNALSMAQAGADIMLNSGEADQVADAALEVLAELGWAAPQHPDGGARQRYAEALAARFTEPRYRCDRYGENEWVENPEPSDRVDQSLTVHYVADDGYPAFRMVTCNEAAEVCAAVRDVELEIVQARIARVDALHQPKQTGNWLSCAVHSARSPDPDCPRCAKAPIRTCSNQACKQPGAQGTWPCETHLALHDETEEECQHRG